jgi:hypothetical protein
MKTWRFRLSLLAVLLALHGLLGGYPQIMAGFGVGRSLVWFRDMHSMLAASDYAREGHDPFLENPYDLGGERHIYPDWWFALGKVGLSRADSLWLGGLLVVLFWFAVFVVLPLRTARDFWWTILVCASPPFWLAVNRANPDLLVFALLTPVVPLLLQDRKWLRLLAPVLVALATGLKFFPALAGAVFLAPAGDRRENWRRWTLLAVLLGLLAWSLTDDVHRYLQADWLGRGLFTFGAVVIPLHYGWDAGVWLKVGRLVGVVLVGWAVLRSPVESITPPAEREQRFGVMGAAVLAGIFFLTVGYLYKIIFVVWLLPVLLSLSAAAGPWQRQARVALVCLAGMVWMEGLACAALTLWPEMLDAPGRVMIRRLAATVSGGLAWGLIVPVTLYLGAQLRSYWQLWRQPVTAP